MPRVIVFSGTKHFHAQALWARQKLGLTEKDLAEKSKDYFRKQMLEAKGTIIEKIVDAKYEDNEVRRKHKLKTIFEFMMDNVEEYHKRQNTEPRIVTKRQSLQLRLTP